MAKRHGATAAVEAERIQYVFQLSITLAHFDLKEVMAVASYLITMTVTAHLHVRLARLQAWEVVGFHLRT